MKAHQTHQLLRILILLALVVVFGVACNVSDLPLPAGLFATEAPPRPTEPATSGSEPTQPPPTATLQSVPPTPVPDTLPVGPDAMRDALQSSVRPAFDPYRWGVEVGLLEAQVGRALNDAPELEVGDTQVFRIDLADISQLALYNVAPQADSPDIAALLGVEAELVDESGEFYLWLEADAVGDVEVTSLAALADAFATTGYATIRDWGVSEWSPGMDADERLHLVFLRGGTVGDEARFRRADEFPVNVYRASAEREVLFVNLDARSPDNARLLSAMTRAYWQMVQYNEDPNETRWSSEGLATLAQADAGYPADGAVQSFLGAVDTPLNVWPGRAGGDPARSAGASYLYHLYVAERMADSDEPPGSVVGGQIAVSEADGLAAVDGLGDADVWFFDWTIANLIDDADFEDGRYGYARVQTGNVCPLESPAMLGQAALFEIAPYSAMYFEVVGGTSLELEFQGPVESPLLATGPFSGNAAWWSGRGAWTEARLSRSLDLTGVTEATLDFALWHDIAPGQDAAYLMVSTDGGQTWEAQPGAHTSAHRDLPAYVGMSGGGLEPAWLQERIDLSAFVGQEIDLAFVYVTADDGAGPGLLLDSISISQIGLSDGAEGLDTSWEAAGWLRTGNVVSNEWGVTIVSEVIDDNGQMTRTVTPVEVGLGGTASIEHALPVGVSRSWVVVALAARGTEIPVAYTLSLGGNVELVEGPTLPPGGLAVENFDSSCGLFKQSSSPTASDTIADGVLLTQVGSPGQSHFVLADDVYGDTVLAADVTLSPLPAQDAGWGAVCRYSGPDDYYAFQVRNDGTAGIFALVGGELVELSPFEASDEILTTPGAVNNIVASCVGETLGLTVNGEVLASAEDESFDQGRLGLVVATGVAVPEIVQFDNVVLTGPTGEGFTSGEEAEVPTAPSVEVCDCSGNIYNCADFANRAEAQQCYNFCGGRSNDVHLLDADFNGIVCETVFP